MSAPTAREIIALPSFDARCPCAHCLLAARVEAVISEIERIRDLVGGDPYHSGDKILRLLDGEKP